MEDAHVVHAGADFAFYCIYDGHGGQYAAQFCKERMHFNVMGSAAFIGEDPREALREGFRKTETDLLAEQREAQRRSSLPTGDCLSSPPDACGETSSEASASDLSSSICCGTTALVALIIANCLHVAWAGDCRAVLSRRGKAVQLTFDHSTTSDSEIARLEASGVEVDGGRLGGFLAVTRALGDLDGVTGSKPHGLLGEPELRSELISPEDEFLLMASDGLFGVLSSDDAVRLAREQLRVFGDASMASEKLVDIALRNNADDNVTALIVCLNPIEEAPPPERPAHLRFRLRKP